MRGRCTSPGMHMSSSCTTDSVRPSAACRVLPQTYIDSSPPTEGEQPWVRRATCRPQGPAGRSGVRRPGGRTTETFDQWR